ncbi:MAG: hypothetical protein V3T22_11830 [Planctomycetota bacterium]
MKSILTLVLVLLLAGGMSFVVWQGLAVLGGSGARPPARPPDRAPQRMPQGAQQPAFAGEEPVAAPAGVPWAVRNAQGIEALEAEDLEAALEAFEECHLGDPHEPIYAGNLAEALKRKAVRLHAAGEAAGRDAALALLARAVELNPGRAELSLTLGRWTRSARAEEGFFTETRAHIEVAYDLNRSEVRSEIRAVGDLLEDAYMEFGESFGFWPVEDGRPRIRVVLYTRSDFDAVTGIGEWAGGVYDGTIRVPVGDLTRELSSLSRVLRHELLHAFVQEAGGTHVPGWLNEGLAQWLENEQVAARDQAVSRARSKLQGVELFDLEVLHGSVASWTDTQAIERAYSQSLALVAYVESQYGDRVVYEMVTRCKDDALAADTFRARIGISLDVVQEDLARELQ